MAWKEHEVTEMRCTICGDPIQGTSKRRVCSKCRRAAERDAKRARRNQGRAKMA